MTLTRKIVGVNPNGLEKMVYYRPECPEVADFCYFCLIIRKYPYDLFLRGAAQLLMLCDITNEPYVTKTDHHGI